MHSIASLTSCTLIIFAPFSKQIVFNIDVPFKASSGFIFNNLLIIDFLDTPTRIGFFIFLNNCKLFKIS